MLNVKVKLLNDKAKMPFQKHATDAGFDLYVSSVKVKNDMAVYGFGIALDIPDGHVGLLFPRSSIANTMLSLSNSVGVIDSSYRGEIMAKFDIDQRAGNMYQIGDRAIQLIIVPFPKIHFDRREELSSTERGTGGYGSTNEK